MFVGEMKKRGLSKALVYMDGAQGKISADILIFLASYNVVVCILPPHSTHKLQPLDIRVFGPLKKIMYAKAAEDGVIISIMNCVYYFEYAFREAVSKTGSTAKDWAIAGFKAAGLFPFNKAIFTDKDFAISDALNAATPAKEAAKSRIPRTPEQDAALLESIRSQKIWCESAEGVKRVQVAKAKVLRMGFVNGKEQLEAMVAQEAAKAVEATTSGKKRGRGKSPAPPKSSSSSSAASASASVEASSEVIASASVSEKVGGNSSASSKAEKRGDDEDAWHPPREKSTRRKITAYDNLNEE